MVKGPYKICIICEGDEEAAYFKRLIQFDGIFSNKYIISIINAGGITQINAVYNIWYQVGNHDVLFVFCDTDKPPYEQFNMVKHNLIEVYGKETIADKLLFYANPSTMQIILSHFLDVKLKSNSKKTNRPIIEKLTGVKDYKAKSTQITAIMNQINKQNYRTLKNNLSKLGTNPTQLSSTNFLILLNYLESDNPQRIKEITKP